MKEKFINAPMILTSNIVAVQCHIGDPNVKTVFVGDLANYDENAIINYGMIPASILLPDYDTMALEVNGDISSYESRYHAYLDSGTAFEMILALIAALMKGTAIILFVPPEASGLMYPITLMEHFLYRFGIQIAFENIPFAYQENFTPIIVKYMYLNDLITPVEYLYYAGSSWCTAEILKKLTADSRLVLTEQEAYAYFSNMQADILKENTTISPVEKIWRL